MELYGVSVSLRLVVYEVSVVKAALYFVQGSQREMSEGLNRNQSRRYL